MKTKVLGGIFGILIVMVLIIGIEIVMAHGDFSESKRLIDSNISCNELSDTQLELIGDYYMEQMHSGEAHELMDKMMGGEDSEFVKLMHINMAKSIYCGENTMMQGSVMGYGMMGSGGMIGMMPMMMNMMGGQNVQGGMMGSWGYGYGYWNVINILYAILLIGLVILVYLWIIKLLKNMQKKR